MKLDLEFLINNRKFSDLEILCGDGNKLFSYRAILVLKSEVFNGLLYNGMKESYEKQISFPTINTIEMEIILEHIYTGSIKEESLTKDNIVEAFYAADYFLLPELQKLIINTFKNNLEKNPTENYSPELLSKAADTMPLSEDNILLNSLVETIATIPLNTIEFGRLSIAALQHLLSCTLESKNPFATSEYEVFRYSAILAAKQVSSDAYKTFTEQLPTLEQIKNSDQALEHKFITDDDHQKVAKELEPLIQFIDFSRIRSQILADIIEPLEIIPIEMVDQCKANDSYEFRGLDLYVWDESRCGSKLIIKGNGKVVESLEDLPHYCVHQSVRAKMTFDNKCVFEWDVIIEKISEYTRIGVCSSENFDYEAAGIQPSGWVLTSDGKFWNSKTWKLGYCRSFGNDTKITVHLDMIKKTLAYTVNGTKYPEVSCDNLPSKLYPVVSLSHSGCIRIQRHQ